MRALALAATVVALLAAPAAEAATCDQTPEPARWISAGTPDKGMENPVISAHRGAIELGPENTLHSYEYAFAYGVDLVEVDVQQTSDGRFVAMHDSTVDRTTNGTGEVSSLTYAQVRALNAADYAPWKGGEFDPAQVASVEEVLALAARVGGGLELDIKGSVTREDELARLVARYGLIEESIFNSVDPRILVVAPQARLIYNRDAFEPPAVIYALGSLFRVFGSRLDEYTPEAVVAAHDACAIVMPHAYDAGPDREVEQFQLARSIGADGVQTNQPGRIVAAAGLAVSSRLEQKGASVCLVAKANGLGFPSKRIKLYKGSRSTWLTAGKGGCTKLPGPSWRGALAVFAGDGAVKPAALRLS